MPRLGIIGIRGQAALWALVASQAPGWRVGACYHPRRSSHNPRSSYFQTARLTELMARSDAIVIASPTPTHLEYLQALSRRFRGPLLIEKPVVGSIKECRRLLRSVRGPALRRIAVTHNWRFQPWVGKIRAILKAEGWRSAIAAEFHLTHDFAYKPAYRRSWRSKRNLHPVGPLETQGIHWIDIAHLLFGPVESIQAWAAHRAWTGSAPDTCSAILRMRGGVVCSIHTSYAAPLAHYARVVTSRSILTYQNGTLTLQRRPVPPPAGRSVPTPQRLLRCDSLDGLSTQPLRAQLALLRQGGAALGRMASCAQAMANVAVLAAATESIHRCRPVRMARIRGYSRWVRQFSV